MYEELIKALRCNGDGISEETDGLGCANKKCKYRDVDGACDLTSMTCDAAAALDNLTARISALQTKNAEKGKEIERLKDIVEAYAESARSIALWLDAYCDRSLPYDKMILDAAQKAVVALSRVEAERDAAVADIEQMAVSLPVCMACQFCAYGTEGMECDECDDCYNFVWRGAQGEG